jgi:hypothetical protein
VQSGDSTASKAAATTLADDEEAGGRMAEPARYEAASIFRSGGGVGNVVSEYLQRS